MADASIQAIERRSGKTKMGGPEKLSQPGERAFDETTGTEYLMDSKRRVWRLQWKRYG